MKYTLISLIALGLIAMAGSAVRCYIVRPGRGASMAERLGVSFMLGLIFIAVAQLFCLTAHIKLSREAVLAPVALLVLARCSFFFVRRERLWESERFSLPRIHAWFIRQSKITVNWSAAELALGVVIVLLAAIMIWTCYLMPLYSWDGRAIWALKAKMLFHQQTVFTPDFQDVTRWHPHQSYPLLVPLIENFVFHVLGAPDEYAVKTIFAAMYLALLGLLYTVQRRFFGQDRLYSLAGTTVFAIAPVLFVTFSGSVLSGYADFPLGCLFAFAVVHTARFKDEGKNEDMLLAAFFTAAVLLCKNEGMSLCALLWAVVLIDRWMSRDAFRARRVQWMRYCAIVVLMALPWFVLRNQLPRVDENSPLQELGSMNFIEGLRLLPLVLKLTCREMFSRFSAWGFFWYLTVLAIVVPFRAQSRFPRRTANFYLLFLPWAYYFFVITPVYIFYVPQQIAVQAEFDGRSFERFRLHVLPLVLLYASYRFSGLFGPPKRAAEDLEVNIEHKEK